MKPFVAVIFLAVCVGCGNTATISEINPNSTDARIESPIVNDAVAKTEVPQSIDVASNEIANIEPVQIVFPAKRKFEHRGEFIEHKRSGRKMKLTMISTAQGILIMADALMDFRSRGDEITLLEAVTMRFVSESDDWKELNPKTISLYIDNETIVNKCMRDGEQLFFMISLAEYAKLLTAKVVKLEIGQITIEFTEKQLEGFRDLASRLPDGETINGNYTVKHQPDL